MRRLKFHTALIALIAFASCNNAKDSVPFPEGSNDLVQQQVFPLKFKEAEKLEKTVIRTDTCKPPEIFSARLETVKPQVFDSTDFHAFPTAIKTTPLPRVDSSFDWEQLPVMNLYKRTTVLGHPSRFKAGLPGLKDGAKLAILLYGEDLNFPGISISNLFQDRHGVLWFSSSKGLCRFDGENYEVFNLQQGMPSGSVNSIKEDAAGMLWVGTTKGLCMLDFDKGLVHTYTAIERFDVKSLQFDRDGTLWFLVNSKLAIMRPGEKKIRHFGLDKPFSESRSFDYLSFDKRGGLVLLGFAGPVYILDRNRKIISGWQAATRDVIYARTCITDGAGRIWVPTYHGINILDPLKNTLQVIDSTHGFPVGYFGGKPFCDRSGQIWVSSSVGVNIIKPDLSAVKHIGLEDGLSSNTVREIYQDKRGKIWIGGGSGLDKIDDASGSSKHYQMVADDKVASIYHLIKDKKGRIWVGYWLNGADIIDEKTGIRKHLDEKNGIHINYVRRFFLDRNGRLLIGSSGKIMFFDEANNLMKAIGKDQGFLMYGNGVRGFYHDEENNYWFGITTGFYIYNELKNKIDYYPGLKQASGWVSCIEKADDENMWIGTANVLEMMNMKKGIRKRIDTKLGSVAEYMKDSKGRLWIAGSLGVKIIDPVSNTITNFSRENGLADDRGVSLVEKDGVIFCITAKGITRFDQDQENKWRLTNFGKTQGFSNLNAYFYNAVFSSSGKLWVGGDKKLTVMNMQSTEGTDAVATITAVNVMDKPTGFHSIHALDLRANDTVWTMAADSFYTKDKLPKDSTWIGKSGISWKTTAGSYNLPVDLSMPYDQNYISFHFTGSELNNADKTRYRFILQGADDSWSNITDQSFADYRNLSPGKYTFKVACRNFNGKWSQPVEYSFTIRPPWWLTWWAYTFYVIAFMGLAVMYSRYRSRKLIAVNQRLEEKVHQRTKDLKQSIDTLKATQAQLVQSEKMASLGELTAGIAHEIQNPLNFVNNFSEVTVELIDEAKKETAGIKDENVKYVDEVLDDVSQNLQKILHHGRRADAIVKGMLQHSRSSAGVKEDVDLNAMIDEYLRLSYHGLRAKDKSFNAIIETQFDASIERIVAIPQDIGRVMLNLFSNAFYSVNEKKKQSGKEYEPAVYVTTKKENGNVLISVKDNGVGIPENIRNKIYQPFFTTKPTGEGTGLGLSLSYDIITKGHSGEMKVETKEGEGAEFIIQLSTNNL
jgi:signal transduction histidine kinase/ligand-binding sensor domain-containing protein